MMYSEFQNWIIDNCPSSIDYENFLEMLACNTAMLVQLASKKSGVSERDLLNDLIKSFEASTDLNS